MSVPIPLTSGAYEAKSVIANAQRCVNLYPEANPGETKPPAPTTHYQRPGKKLIGAPSTLGVARNLYTASNGNLFATVGNTVYFIDLNWNFFPLGQIADGVNPVSMADNGQFAGNQLVLVDGTISGYIINMTTLFMALLVDPTGLFTGADVVNYLQTFFLFNTIPNTQNWIISQSDSATFDALDIAAKATYPDSIVTIGVRQREVWLLGTQTTEPWFLSGAADFPFEAIPSTFVSYGCAAKYSQVFADISLFWVSKNKDGKAIIVKSEGYQATKISTFAIEQELQKFTTIEDAVGTTYQIGGHIFIKFTFPSGNKTYTYDLSTKQWFQEAWADTDGVLHRDRVLFHAQAYQTSVGIDWETGMLYEIDPETYTDNGDPVQYIRSFPTITAELKRITHWALMAYMETGTIEDPNAPMPQLNMRYSDDGGHTWGNAVQSPLGATGEYQTVPQFQRLGMARNRVYELFWSEDMKTALNGVYIDPEAADS
jgi:hypothetical protein